MEPGRRLDNRAAAEVDASGAKIGSVSRPPLQTARASKVWMSLRPELTSYDKNERQKESSVPLGAHRVRAPDPEGSTRSRREVDLSKDRRLSTQFPTKDLKEIGAIVSASRIDCSSTSHRLTPGCSSAHLRSGRSPLTTDIFEEHRRMRRHPARSHQPSNRAQRPREGATISHR